MKTTIVVVLMIISVALCFGQPSAVEQMKSDLVGQSMGGREKCWRFQSVDQIKECTIDKTTEDAAKRVCLVSMKLQDPRIPGAYNAKAQVTYVKFGVEWKIKSVGLLSLMKVE